MEETQFKIVLEGDEEAIREGRISLTTMWEPMRLLLVALQRTAAGIVALNQPEEDGDITRPGRLPVEANAIDLEIVEVRKGSMDVMLSGRMRSFSPPRNRRVAENLLHDSADRLLTDLESEGAGRERNPYARAYLRSLPAGVTTQRYELWRDGQKLREIKLGALKAPPVAVPRAVARVLTGTIAAIGFEAGKQFVEIRTENKIQRLMAIGDAASTDRAFAMRTDLVSALAVFPPDQPARLVWIRRGSDQWRPAPSLVEDYIFGRWSKTLARLAQ